MREPLVYFLLIAFLIYGLMPEDKEPIKIDRSALEHYISAKEQLLGRALAPNERESLKRQYIDDEILLHEAIKENLYRGEEVKNLLVSQLKYTMQEQLRRKPSQKELQRLYRQEKTSKKFEELLPLLQKKFYEQKKVEYKHKIQLIKNSYRIEVE